MLNIKRAKILTTGNLSSNKKKKYTNFSNCEKYMLRKDRFLSFFFRINRKTLGRGVYARIFLNVLRATKAKFVRRRSGTILAREAFYPAQARILAG